MDMGGMFFNGFGDVISYTIKVWVGDALVEHKTMNLPSGIAEQQFKQTVQQLANEKAPMKVEYSYQTEVVNSDNIDSISFTNALWDKAHKETSDEKKAT